MERAAHRIVGETSDSQHADEIRDSIDERKVRILLADGHRWLVREAASPSFDRRGGLHLIFDAETVVRRVRAFPDDWLALSDEALYALTDQFHPDR